MKMKLTKSEKMHIIYALDCQLNDIRAIFHTTPVELRHYMLLEIQKYESLVEKISQEPAID